MTSLSFCPRGTRFGLRAGLPASLLESIPHGYGGDATYAVLDQIERFAPGFRDTVVGRHVTSPVGFAAYNANDVGGDIAGGANSLPQLVARPVLSANPCATGIPGVYLCSASTPPGAGVRGMCGWQAAQRALAYLDSSAGR